MNKIVMGALLCSGLLAAAFAAEGNGADAAAAPGSAKTAPDPGTTPLMAAAAAGNVKTMKRLLAEGAHVNARNANGATALFAAVAGGYREAVKMLLAHGAGVNVQDNEGNTPLHIAALGGDEDVVWPLIEAGASDRIRNQEGFTPSELAYEEDNDRISLIIKTRAKH